ncbi:MAG TPA: sigma-70 family RNA polymerase sigma factor [Polyangium sp.]|nr:sigma-70 family RNA polymerase sigma factor [Polyangium sp.]
MSKTPSDKPPKKSEESVSPSAPKPVRAKRDVIPFGLSAAQFVYVTRKMLAAARLVCRHSGISPGDAVQQAFVKALCKPITERPSIQNEKKFVAWLCTLAKYEAMTNRQSQRRRAQREVDINTDMTELLDASASISAVEARKMLEDPLRTLDKADQEFLRALFVEGKTIEELAAEQQVSRSKLEYQRQRILDLLYAAVQFTVVALVLVPRKARAFVAHAKQQTSQMLMQAAHVGGTCAVTVVCGMVLPTGSSEWTDPVRVSLTKSNTEQTNTTKAAVFEPSLVPKVEPEEPKALDAATNECSAVDMKSTKIASYLQETLVPLAFVVAPALTQVACVGTEQQTPPARQPEEEPTEEPDGSPDPYDVACDNYRMWRVQCPTREEWYRGVRPR